MECTNCDKVLFPPEELLSTYLLCRHNNEHNKDPIHVQCALKVVETIQKKSLFACLECKRWCSIGKNSIQCGVDQFDWLEQKEEDTIADQIKCLSNASTFAKNCIKETTIVEGRYEVDFFPIIMSFLSILVMCTTAIIVWAIISIEKDDKNDIFVGMFGAFLGLLWISFCFMVAIHHRPLMGWKKVTVSFLISIFFVARVCMSQERNALPNLIIAGLSHCIWCAITTIKWWHERIDASVERRKTASLCFLARQLCVEVLEKVVVVKQPAASLDVTAKISTKTIEQFAILKKSVKALSINVETMYTDAVIRGSSMAKIMTIIPYLFEKPHLLQKQDKEQHNNV
jgi:hypothetical protein